MGVHPERGPYLGYRQPGSDQAEFCDLPREIEVESVTLEEAIELKSKAGRTRYRGTFAKYGSREGNEEHFKQFLQATAD